MPPKQTHSVARFLTTALVTFVVACSGFFSSVVLAVNTSSTNNSEVADVRKDLKSLEIRLNKLTGASGAAAQQNPSYPEGSKLKQAAQNCNLLGGSSSDPGPNLFGKVLSNVNINTPIGSVSINGCEDSNAPALNGPGAYDGLQMFKRDYKGNHYGSAMGILAGWTNFALPFVSIISIIALIYAGFLYITALGNDEQTGKAKKIILWVVVGIIVIYSAYALVNTVISGTSG